MSEPQHAKETVGEPPKEPVKETPKEPLKEPKIQKFYNLCGLIQIILIGLVIFLDIFRYFSFDIFTKIFIPQKSYFYQHMGEYLTLYAQTSNILTILVITTLFISSIFIVIGIIWYNGREKIKKPYGSNLIKKGILGFILLFIIYVIYIIISNLAGRIPYTLLEPSSGYGLTCSQGEYAKQCMNGPCCCSRGAVCD